MSETEYFASILFQCGCGRTQCSRDYVRIFGPYPEDSQATKVSFYLADKFRNELHPKSDYIVRPDICLVEKFDVTSIIPEESSEDESSSK